ncbi:PTS sugar transporter subunit IIA [Lichenicoccus roseus]|uniref:PTS fructose transporter subunit IIA n=1 Tax=Lichenicoccus roseus TaxID=2683649 RepID=A0A5R9J2U7_9PROT|nr:PTS fructose transporter subunit IIA [Lichenicoccus roseus]TLU71872.1 PTS fructose transporter subunit IIA [Lichenicoccus roseus]
MIGMVLITHGELGEMMRAAMEHVVGPQKQVGTLSIGADDQITGCRKALQAQIDQVDTGDGVMLLTDMFGSTPSNLAIAAMERGGVEVIAGVNLPMLVKLAKVRSSRTLEECTDIAETAGRKYIAAASHLPSSCLGGAACCGNPLLTSEQPPVLAPVAG